MKQRKTDSCFFSNQNMSELIPVTDNPAELGIDVTEETLDFIEPLKRKFLENKRGVQ